MDKWTEKEKGERRWIGDDRKNKYQLVRYKLDENQVKFNEKMVKDAEKVVSRR